MNQFHQFFHLFANDPLAMIFTIIGILVLEVVLSFDNAAVLATMVKDLPKEQQDKALRYGILGAYVFRGIALVLVGSILEIWWLKPIGGAYLLYMAIRHFLKKSEGGEEEQHKDTKETFIYRYTIGLVGVFWSTVIAVEFMDIVFSIDNIFAVVAYTENLVVICIGVFIGILAMRYVAKYFVVLMEKFPFLEDCAFIVIGLLGVKLCLSLLVKLTEVKNTAGKMVSDYAWIESENFDLVVSCLTLAVFIVPVVYVRFLKKK